MAGPRKTLPANALGPVQRKGDRARLQDEMIKRAQATAKAASGVKPPSATLKTAPAYSRPTTPAQAQQKMVSMKAPTSSVRPNRAGSTFTPGSRADMAYTAVKSAPVASGVAKAALKPKRLGSGVEGAMLTAAAGAGYALYDKFKKRGKKPAK